MGPGGVQHERGGPGRGRAPEGCQSRGSDARGCEPLVRRSDPGPPLRSERWLRIASLRPQRRGGAAREKSLAPEVPPGLCSRNVSSASLFPAAVRRTRGRVASGGRGGGAAGRPDPAAAGPAGPGGGARAGDPRGDHDADPRGRAGRGGAGVGGAYSARGVQPHVRGDVRLGAAHVRDPRRRDGAGLCRRDRRTGDRGRAGRRDAAARRPAGRHRNGTRAGGVGPERRATCAGKSPRAARRRLHADARPYTT